MGVVLFDRRRTRLVVGVGVLAALLAPAASVLVAQPPLHLVCGALYAGVGLVLARRAAPRVGGARLVALSESRARVVAAADAERRRLERDLHDGAQQHLIGISVNLRLARELIASDPSAARELLA